LDKGMVDMVVDRRQLKATLATMLSVLMHKRVGARNEEDESFELAELAPEEEEQTETPARTRRPKTPRAKAAE
jgi:hypothetical protein